MKISYCCLIYKSTKWLQFVYDQFMKHTVMKDDDEFFFVANDACDDVLQYLQHNNIKHYIHQNTDKQRDEWYINNVYRAWNECTKRANGDYIIFLNSDFAFSPDWNTNLINKLSDNNCVVSRLIERGVMSSGKYGIEFNFGNNYNDYNENAFLHVVEKIKENKLYEGGLYMPLLINKKHLEMVGHFPEGNVRVGCDIFNPVIAKKGERLLSGDFVLMEKLKRINVKHMTAFDSIIYHFQEGEMRE